MVDELLLASPHQGGNQDNPHIAWVSVLSETPHRELRAIGASLFTGPHLTFYLNITSTSMIHVLKQLSFYCLISKSSFRMVPPVPVKLTSALSALCITGSNAEDPSVHLLGGPSPYLLSLRTTSALCD